MGETRNRENKQIGKIMKNDLWGKYSDQYSERFPKRFVRKERKMKRKRIRKGTQDRIN